MTHKIHFSFEPGKGAIETFASSLIKDIGQTDFAEADTIVSIGGDGSLLHVFRRAHNGQSVFGLVPPTSNSRGFWTNRGIEDADILLDSLSSSKQFQVNPLNAEVYFKDGSSEAVKAFNEVTPSENSGQAMLVELTIRSPNSEIGPIRVMGDGLILATPFGSTAVNSTYGGSAIDIRNSGIAIAGKGVFEPKGGFRPIVASDDTCFEIQFLSPEKRPVRLQYDGLVLSSHEANPFEKMTVQKDRNHAVGLLLIDDPSTRAFAAMTPH